MPKSCAFGIAPAEASTALATAVALYEQKGNVASAVKAHALLNDLRDAPRSAL
jgi:hypothetical protein